MKSIYNKKISIYDKESLRFSDPRAIKKEAKKIIEKYPASVTVKLVKEITKQLTKGKTRAIVSTSLGDR